MLLMSALLQKPTVTSLPVPRARIQARQKLENPFPCCARGDLIKFRQGSVGKEVSCAGVSKDLGGNFLPSCRPAQVFKRRRIGKYIVVSTNVNLKGKCRTDAWWNSRNS